MAAGKAVPLSLGDLTETMTSLDTEPAKLRAAALTTAEAAIAGGWTRDDLVDVLGSLGLADTTAVAS